VVGRHRADRDPVDISLGGSGNFFGGGVEGRVKFNAGASRLMGVRGGFVVCDPTYRTVEQSLPSAGGGGGGEGKVK